MATCNNITIGIDLGTTNSEIAIYNSNRVEIIKSSFGDEFTPSVFGVDNSGHTIVGKKAYEKLFKDTDGNNIKNIKSEVKRTMGTSNKIHFDNVDKEFMSEEISAEILKQLKADLLRKHPNYDTTAAVITVPAHFSTLQAEATKRAALLAGFKHAVLLQEPIAAAIAYGFSGTTNENWLVFDLGGGTFDVALVSSREGSLSIINHDGDNFLGGKDMDWLIVDNFIAPHLAKTFKLKEFNRNNGNFKSVFLKLKYMVEQAKIELTSIKSTMIEVDNLCSSPEGKAVSLQIELTQKQLEKLVAPVVDKCILTVKQTIEQSGVNISSIKKIILVGGPTQIPCIRKKLEDTFEIEVTSSVDPLTVVAQGACIFATSQQIPKELSSKTRKKDTTHKINFNFESLTSETEETVTGQLDTSLDDGSYLMIQSDSGYYKSDKIKIKKGKFIETVSLEKHKNNLFWVYLFGVGGEKLDLDQDSFSITHGLSVAGAPIPHTVGVSIVKKDINSNFQFSKAFEPIFTKGSILPLKSEPIEFKTSKSLLRGEENDLQIEVLEGESDLPDRNTFICGLNISGKELPKDLPEGTRVILTLAISESREVSVDVYIPDINLTLPARGSVYAEDITVKELEQDIVIEKARLNAINSTCNDEERHFLESQLKNIESNIKNVESDEDERRKLHKHMKDFKVAIDNVEKEKAFPQLLQENIATSEMITTLIELVDDSKQKDQYVKNFEQLSEDTKRAKQNGDKHLLIRINELLFRLSGEIWYSLPQVWIKKYEELSKQTPPTNLEKEYEEQISKGDEFIKANNLEGLKESVRSMLNMLPQDKQQSIRVEVVGITR